MAKSCELGKPRSCLNNQRSFAAQLGAFYPIKRSPAVAGFFGDLTREWTNVLPPLQVEDKFDTLKTHHQNLFSLWEDPRDQRLSVVDSRLIAAFTNRQRTRWNRNDVGRKRNEIESDLGRLGLLDDKLTVTFDQAIRLSDIDKRSGGRQVTLTVDPENLAYATLMKVQERVIVGVGIDYDEYRELNGEYLPNWTIGTVFGEANPAQFDEAVIAAGGLLPVIGVTTQALQIDSRSVNR